jgi:hypothetical protein
MDDAVKAVGLEIDVNEKDDTFRIKWLEPETPRQQQFREHFRIVRNADKML